MEVSESTDTVATLAEIEGAFDEAGPFGDGGLRVVESGGTLHIAGLDEAVAANERVLAMLRSYECDGTDDERKRNDRFLAAVRKRRKRVSDAVRDLKRTLTAGIDEDAARLLSTFDDVVGLAKERREASNAAFRRGRDEMFSAIWSAMVETAGLDVGSARVSDFSDGLYLRSLSDSRAQGSMSRRIQTYRAAVASDALSGASPDDVVRVLSESGWDLVAAIGAWGAETTARAEQEEAERARRVAAAARRAEHERRTTGAPVYDVVTIRVEHGRVADAMAAIAAAGIRAEMVG